MYKRTTYRWLKHWDFIILDFILLQIAFIIAYIMRNGLSNPYDNMLYQNTAVTIGFLDLCISFFMESYSKVLRRGYWLEFQKVVRHVLLVTLGTICYLFLLKVSAEYSRLAMIYFTFIAIVLLYIGRILLKLWLKKRIVPDSRRRSIMLVGAKENYQQLTDVFLDNQYSEFRVRAVAVIDEPGGRKSYYRDVPVATQKDNILDFIKNNWVDEVLFSMPAGVPLPDELIEQCKLMGITTHLKLARLENEHVNQLVETIEGYTVLSTSISMATPMQLFLKRALDIVGGVVGLIFTGILFIFVAPIIYIKSSGPIFFTQIRVGRNGRKFKLYKFRSMYMDAEERKKELMSQNNMKDGFMFKMDDDPRIIKGIGHFIRKYSIDEFPQFWNVLKGDMSLVGTRPPTLDEWEKYELHHRRRLTIKPGITGLWQVSGRSEIIDFEEVVKLDTKYIREWNLGMDFKILLKTVQVVFQKKGAM